MADVIQQAGNDSKSGIFSATEIDLMEDVWHDEGAESKPFGGEDSAEDGERATDFLDIELSKEAKILQEGDDQNLLRRTRLRGRRNISGENDEQSVAQNKVAMNSENSNREFFCSKTVKQGSSSLAGLTTTQAEDIESYRVANVTLKTELGKIRDIVSSNKCFAKKLADDVLRAKLSTKNDDGGPGAEKNHPGIESIVNVCKSHRDSQRKIWRAAKSSGTTKQRVTVVNR